MKTKVMKNIATHQLLGKWLRERRVAAGMSQTQLANQIGRNNTFIGKYEAGQRLEIMEFIRIVKVLNADFLDALSLVEDDN